VLRDEHSALVLAGGAARRLGGFKAERRVGGRTLLGRALDVAHDFAGDVLLAAGERRLPAECLLSPDGLPRPLREVHEEPRDQGPLVALGAGLAVARRRWCALLPCDMPFARAELLFALRERADRAERDGEDPEAVVLLHEGRRQPFQALYRPSLAVTIRQLVASGSRSLAALLDAARVTEVVVSDVATAEFESEVLVNVNTPDDLALAHGRSPS